MALKPVLTAEEWATGTASWESAADPWPCWPVSLSATRDGDQVELDDEHHLIPKEGLLPVATLCLKGYFTWDHVRGLRGAEYPATALMEELADLIEALLPPEG